MAGVYSLDGIPSDLLSSEFENARRLKTSSRSSIDEAAVNGKAYSITGDVTIASGETLAFNIYLSCKSLIHSIICDGLDVQLFDGLVSGDYSAIKQGRSLNLIDDSGSLFYSQLVYNIETIGLTQLISGVGLTEVGVVTDNTKPVSVVIMNNGESEYTGELSVRVEVVGLCVDTFGLLSDTQLESNSEMSAYG